MRYVHTNIAARDWRKLADFYINVFDCRIKPPVRNLDGEWLAQATGVQDAQLEGAHLILPGHGENAPTLEIFTWKTTHATPAGMPNHTGFTHIAFEVEDVQQSLDLARRNGATMLGAITQRVVENVGTLEFVYFRDPEGNIVEIMSWHK